MGTQRGVMREGPKADSACFSSAVSPEVMEALTTSAVMATLPEWDLRRCHPVEAISVALNWSRASQVA